MLSATGNDTVAIVASLSTLGAFIVAAIGLWLALRSASRTDHERIAREKQEAIDAAVAQAKAMMQLKVDELKANLRGMTEDRNYWRTKADDLEGRLGRRS
jgi:predicted permease